MRKRSIFAAAAGLVALFAGLVVALTASPAAAADLNWREFVGMGSNRCLDVDTHSNTTVQLWNCDRGDDEAFGLQYGGTVDGGISQYLIVNKRTGRCLYSAGISYASGVPIVAGSCNALTRWWYFPDTTGPVTRIVNLYSGLCLDARGNGTGNGVIVQQYTCNGTTAQQWRDAIL